MDPGGTGESLAIEGGGGCQKNLKGEYPMNLWDFLQWPAMLVTVAAAWLVTSRHAKRRNSGFWFFLVSNVLWIAWAVPSKAWALIVLQIALLVMNIRGAAKTDDGKKHAENEHGDGQVH